MSQMNMSSAPAQPSAPPKPHGFFTVLLWDTPWHIIGMLLVSLLFSLIVEYIGIAFFWPDQGRNIVVPLCRRKSVISLKDLRKVCSCHRRW